MGTTEFLRESVGNNWSSSVIPDCRPWQSSLKKVCATHMPTTVVIRIYDILKDCVKRKFLLPFKHKILYCIVRYIQIRIWTKKMYFLNFPPIHRRTIRKLCDLWILNFKSLNCYLCNLKLTVQYLKNFFFLCLKNTCITHKPHCACYNFLSDKISVLKYNRNAHHPSTSKEWNRLHFERLCDKDLAF